MGVSPSDGSDPIEIVQKITQLLDAAAFDTTYKLATLEALIGLVGGSLDAFGNPRESYSAREISDRVLDRYWNQTASFVIDGSSKPHLLRQRGGGQGGDLVSRVFDVRVELGMTSYADSLVRARKTSPASIAKLETLAWERIVDMPLPRLQRFGTGSQAIEERFLYEYGWGVEGPKKHLSLARKNDSLILKHGVARSLLVLQPLLLRHIEALWLRLVADWNPGLTNAGRLNEALFGSQRRANRALVEPLAELQNGKCFYCGAEFGSSVEVDHFLPWSATRNDNVENLVASCSGCNAKKSDSLAAPVHILKWTDRLADGSLLSGVFAEIAEKFARNLEPAYSIGQARGLYLYSIDKRPLWLLGDDYSQLDKDEIKQVLAELEASDSTAL